MKALRLSQLLFQVWQQFLRQDYSVSKFLTDINLLDLEARNQNSQNRIIFKILPTFFILFILMNIFLRKPFSKQEKFLLAIFTKTYSL